MGGLHNACPSARPGPNACPFDMVPSQTISFLPGVNDPALSKNPHNLSTIRPELSYPFPYCIFIPIAAVIYRREVRPPDEFPLSCLCLRPSLVSAEHD